MALLLYCIFCAPMSPGRAPARSLASSGEVLQMFNGGVVNVLWLCFFTIFFVLQCLWRGLRSGLAQVSSAVGGGAANVQRLCYKRSVVLLLYYNFCASKSPARCCKCSTAMLQMLCGSASLLYLLCFNVSSEVSGEMGEPSARSKSGGSFSIWFESNRFTSFRPICASIKQMWDLSKTGQNDPTARVATG